MRTEFRISKNDGGKIMSLKTIFLNYQDAENHIPKLEPGIYQIQKIFIVRDNSLDKIAEDIIKKM